MAGCGIDGENNDENGDEDRRALTDEEALALIRDDVPFLDGVDDERVAELAEENCGVWDTVEETGLDPDTARLMWVRSTMEDTGMEPGEAGAYNAYSVAWKCPEHTDLADLGTGD